MNLENYIDEEYLLLERPNIKNECNIKNNEEMNNYLIAYNVYNNLLIQFIIKKFNLKKFDSDIEKYEERFPIVNDSEKDLYQYSSNGYLKYFYIRNNIHIERLTKKEIDYLYSVYNSKNFRLNEEKEKFIEDNFMKVLVENTNSQNSNINYGPDNIKYYKPDNALILGIRYDKFKSIDKKEDAYSTFLNNEGMISLISDFLEQKVRKEFNLQLFVIQYDEFSINCKKSDNFKSM